MRRPDDSTLSPHQGERIRVEAAKALQLAGAIGRFPTPIDEIMNAARVEEIPEDVLNESFLQKMRKKAAGSLRRALGKVLGLFDAKARLVFIDRTIHLVRQRFVRLHETAHGFLPWHRDLYSIVEDCEQTLAPEAAEIFDREANTFASEVLFQLDGFTNEAANHPFGISVPLKLSRKYGASAYATIRRYVSHSAKSCTVLVLDPPELSPGIGFRCNLRRVVSSAEFEMRFGHIAWPGSFTPSDRIGAMVPLAPRKMTGKRSLVLNDLNGDEHECIAEAFTQGYQVFVLILASQSVRASVIAIAG